MTFFKTIWFKCIACLLILMLFSGSSITILADLLYVSPEMRTARAIKKIYGEEKEYSVVLDVDSKDENKNTAIEYDGVGSVNKIYEISGGDILFQTTGYQGYKNGTITLWVQVRIAYSGDVVGGGGIRYSISKVLLEKYEKQTLMSKLSGDFYGGFNLTDITEAYNNGNFFVALGVNVEKIPEEINNPVSGATYSATAACNAVNCVIRYLGGER